MKYEECYALIINNFHSKIKTSDKKLHNKIFLCLLSWYKNNYESVLKECFLNDDQPTIVRCIKEIENVCLLDDYQKVQKTYQSEKMEILNQLSNKIFELVKKLIDFGENNLHILDCEKMVNMLNDLESQIPDILIERYKFIRSECLLDLEFIKSNGNISTYSFRTHDYLKRNHN